jgi:hypothetical protein
MQRGDARRTCVQVQVRMGIESTHLRLIDLVDHIAVAQGQIASSNTLRSFQNQAFIALATELVGSGEAGNAGAQDEHPAPL